MGPPEPFRDTDVCQAVMSKVTAARNAEEERLDETLYDVIDPDALESLFAGRDSRDRGATGYVSFTFGGCRVVVWSTGDVDVSTRQSDSDGRLDQRRASGSLDE